MSHVVIIGCGVVGAAIAYELSQVPGLKVTVLDKQPPAQAATKAALGVLMGVISHKTKGKAWQMRQASIQRYETLIPELEALTGHHIPFNRQGILMVCREKEDLASWEKLAAVRASGGWQLEIWDAAKVLSRCPQLNGDRLQYAAIYSPQDRQVDPVSLTLALVEAAKRNGVTFHFGVTVEGYDLTTSSASSHAVRQIKTKGVEVEMSRRDVFTTCSAPLLQDVNWLVVSAGLGSLQSLQGIQARDTSLASPAPPALCLKPVLGQAIHLKLSHPMGNPDFQPVITGDDVHIVPCGGGKATEYWVGATVEFPTDDKEVVANAALLEQVMQQAIALCPALAQATIVRTWSGLRPRPEGRPAPVIGHLPGFTNVLLATGHYRNGVLLAPATAQMIRQMILSPNS
jgi:glycine/D-amino acid oxidase-like deaminating enzyme